MAKGVSRQPVQEVDLHGLREHIGEERIRKFMAAAIASGARAVRVIHGHGKGVMKEVTERWLSDHADKVEQHIYENGRILIYLKPKR
ncbi:Smr/MutS family protein [Patescibacteria group bacterium]|jgi:DNA-nicking Smr family endonuclease|nr:Smr/MutS family protein [Patescibacteria group bacterium]